MLQHRQFQFPHGNHRWSQPVAGLPPQENGTNNFFPRPEPVIYSESIELQWAKVSSGKFAILEHQMDPSSNFSSYRSTLKAAMWRSAGATDERQRIVIPFFSLLVKDLYFLNEGCASK